MKIDPWAVSISLTNAELCGEPDDLAQDAAVGLASQYHDAPEIREIFNARRRPEPVQEFASTGHPPNP
jgi:hypothetical protein